MLNNDLSNQEKQSLDNKMNTTIIYAQLDSETNPFFKEAANQTKVSVKTALDIAYNWHEITKTFLFTAIKGVGSLANEMLKYPNVSLKQLAVFQNIYCIISDDLNNNHPFFKKVSPIGAEGIHFKWWETDILNPLEKKQGQSGINLSAGTNHLIQQMQKMAEDPLGVVVQLQVVETIAYDISVAFYSVFNNIYCNNKKFFDQPQQLRWITSHIEAEKIHHQQVCDELAGMSYMANSIEKQQQLFSLATEHTAAWAAALNDFAYFLKKS